MFYVGQKVECIRDGDWGTSSPWNYPIKGHIYTIRDLMPPTPAQIALHGTGKVVRLSEVRNNNDWSFAEPGFGEGRFRPLVEKKTDISIFMKMLHPNGELVR